MTAMKKATATREHMPFDPHGPPVRLLWYRTAIIPEIPLNYHTEIEFQLVRRGALAYTVRDKKYLLRPNSLLVIYPNEIHSTTPVTPEVEVEKITLILKPAFAGLPANGKIPGHPQLRHVRLTADELTQFTCLATDIQAELDHQAEKWVEMCRLKAMELLILIIRAAGHPVEADFSNPVVARVLQEIDQRFSRPITNEDLARAVGLSISRLTHLFSEHMGIGIKQYITQLRMLKACEILVSEPGLKIESVAQAVGFKYSADFNIAFKAHTRLTPDAYRTAHRTTH